MVEKPQATTQEREIVKSFNLGGSTVVTIPQKLGVHAGINFWVEKDKQGRIIYERVALATKEAQ